MASYSYAQLDVQDVAAPPYDPVSLIYNELLGEGVKIVDVQYEGANSSVGFFSNAKDQMGIESGILLTTGAVRTVGANIGVDQVGSVEASVDNGSNVQDGDMTSLADFSLFNISKYTITFIPSSDSIQFRYVFASEEYPEFVCSDYNDIFGFFISGPGINGTYENNAENIATISGTDIPVKINNVNSGQVGAEGVLSNCQNGDGYLNFSQFYVDNEGSFNEPVFDGFTKVFTASAKVIPCETYTIKLVVADQGDPQRDSGVFLEAKSFSSESIEVSVLTESIDGTIIEGCTDANIVINLTSPATRDIDLDVQISGNALEGTDFPAISPAIIPAGQTSTTITVPALEDGVEEGLEEILFDVQINQCFRDTFSLLINDNKIPVPELGGDTTICEGATIQLDGNVLENLPEPITFEASSTNLPIISPPPGGTPSELVADLDVFGIQPLALKGGLIQSVCLDIEHNRLQDLLVYLEAPDGQLIPLSTRKGGTDANYSNTCFSPDATTSIRQGSAPFTGIYSPEGNWSNLWGNATNGTWKLRIIDEVFGFNGILNSWSLTFNPVVSYTYEWKDANGLSCTDCPNPTVTPTESTDYIIEVTNNYACVSTDTFRVTIPEQIEADPVITCTDQSYTSLSFAWEPIEAATAFEINVNNTNWTPLSKDSLSYTVTSLGLDEEVSFAVRAIGGCNSREQSSTCRTLDCQPIMLDQEQLQTPTCNGATDGSITISAISDNGPFTYALLSEGSTNPTGVFENLGAGDYTIEVTDALGCSTTFDRSLSQPTPLTATPSLLMDIQCAGENGSGTAIVSGGTPPYQIVWDHGQTDSIFTTDTQGFYTANITDANGCQTTASVQIAGPSPLSSNSNATLTCQGEAMGSASIEGIGGAGDFTYQWDAAANNQTGSTATDLAAGQYFVTATDVNGCTIIDSVEVSAIDTLATPIVSCTDITNNSITFVWTEDPIATGFEINVNNSGWESPSNALSHSVAGLSLGETVAIEVRGIGNCTPPIGTNSCTTLDCTPIMLDTTLVHISCNGATDGAITVAASGGQGDFQYTLDGTTNTSGVFDQLAAGSYLASVEDAFGCVASLAVTLEEPTLLEVAITVDSHESCSSLGALSAEPTGGQSPYQLEWSTTATLSTIDDLTAGTYQITVTDANNCTATTMATIDGQEGLELTLTAMDASCQEANGSATATVTGGTADYTYLWNDEAQQTTEIAANLVAGTYRVTATDAEGCMVVDSIEIATTDTLATPTLSCTDITNSSVTFVWTDDPVANGFEININDTNWGSPADLLSHQITGLELGESVTLQVRGIGDCAPPVAVETCTTLDCTPIEIDTTLLHVTCNGASDGSIQVTATGGQGTLQYTLDGATNTSGTFEQLTAGNYLVAIEDEFGCIVSTAITLEEPSALAANITIDSHQSCEASGQLTVTATGGVGPYQYEWNTGDMLSTVNELSAGDYTVTIIDANNCMTTTTATINGANTIQVELLSTPVNCANATDGSITTTVTGGVGPYQYDWSTGATDQNIRDVAAGTYSVTVVDADGCSTTQSTTLSPVGAGTITASVVQPLCPEETGSIDLEMIDIPTPYSVLLNGVSRGSNNTIANLTAGEYNIEVLDANNCLYQVDTATINTITPLSIAMPSIPTLQIGNSIEVVPEVTGGTAPYTFSWTANQSDVLSCTTCEISTIQPLTTTNFLLQVTDANDCEAIASLTAVVNKERRIYAPTAFSPNTDGINDRFTLHGVGESVELLRIFDRWGNLVFEKSNFSLNDETIGWDGTYNGQLMNNGIFIWFAQVRFNDGEVELVEGELNILAH